MKFTVNDVLTIGTLYGANLEIREEIGVKFFLFFGGHAISARTISTQHPRTAIPPEF